MSDNVVWFVRAPKGPGSLSISDGLAPVDVGVHEDITGHGTLEEMLAEVRHARPDLNPAKAESRARCLLLMFSVKAGDLVIILDAARGITSGVLSGEITMSQQGLPSLVFTSPKTHPRSVMPQDMLNSMRAHAAFSKMNAPDAHERLSAMREGGKDPGPDQTRELAIRAGARMEAYELAELVADLLRTDGYRCRIAPPGPDGGVDIWAGKGLLGIGDSLLVQVKSGSQVVSGPQVYQILGNSAECGSNATLIVSWSGFTADARKIISKNPFKIVGWDFNDLFNNLQAVKHNVPDKWQNVFFIS